MGLRSKAFPAKKGKKLTRWNTHRLEDIYDLDRPESRNTNVRDILDMFIHSLAFAEVIGLDKTVEGILLTSERNRAHLWLIDIQKFTALMRHVANDRPSTLIRTADFQNNDWIEWRGKGDPPHHVVEKMSKTPKR